MYSFLLIGLSSINHFMWGIALYSVFFFVIFLFLKQPLDQSDNTCILNKLVCYVRLASFTQFFIIVSPIILQGGSEFSFDISVLKEILFLLLHGVIGWLPIPSISVPLPNVSSCMMNNNPGAYDLGAYDQGAYGPERLEWQDGGTVYRDPGDLLQPENADKIREILQGMERRGHYLIDNRHVISLRGAVSSARATLGFQGEPHLVFERDQLKSAACDAFRKEVEFMQANHNMPLNYGPGYSLPPPDTGSTPRRI